jgi:hypothetical protein
MTVLCACGSLNTLKFDDASTVCFDCGWDSGVEVVSSTSGGKFVPPVWLTSSYAPYSNTRLMPANGGSPFTMNEIRAMVKLPPVKEGKFVKAGGN